jgi:phosphate transport system substrate-binding protein
VLTQVHSTTFTEAINGRAKSSRSDYTASEDDNVLVTGVAGDKGGLGYFGLAYYLENKDKLNAVAIVAKGKKDGVLPSEQLLWMAHTNLFLAHSLFMLMVQRERLIKT